MTFTCHNCGSDVPEGIYHLCPTTVKLDGGGAVTIIIPFKNEPLPDGFRLTFMPAVLR